MARYAARLLDSWERPDNGFGSQERFLQCGLGDGYFVTTAPGGELVELWNVSDPTTLVDDVTLASGDGIRDQARNNSGKAWARLGAAAGTTKKLAEITQSGGVLSITEVGSFTTDASNGVFYLSADDSEIIFQQGTPRRTFGLSTTDASENYDITWSGSGHTCWVVATPAPDRFIAYCSDHTDYELWEGSTQTLLDNMNDTAGRGSDVYPCSVNINQVLWVARTGTDTHDVGLLDTSADILSWSWGPTSQTFTGWDTIDAIAEASGTLVTLAPESSPADPDPSISFYIVDTTTGTVSASEASDLIGAGANFSDAVGAIWVDSSTVALGASTPDDVFWSSWAVSPVAPSTLRQRQSPKRTPSRIRGTDLRARQTPFL